MTKLITIFFLLNISAVFAYDWKDKPDSFFYRVGEYASPKDQFLWMDNKKKQVQIQFYDDILLKGKVVADLNQSGFSVNGELKCKLFDNYNVKFGDGSEEAWFIDNDLKKEDLQNLKKQFRKYRVCDVPPLYNIVEKTGTFRYIAPAKLVDGQRSVFKTKVNGKDAFFQFKGGRILYSLEWRKKRHKECMERFLLKETQGQIKETLKCIKKKNSYSDCNVSGYSRNQCELEELYGYPKGKDYTGNLQTKKDQKKITKALNLTLEDALEVENGEDYEIAKCELMDNGEAELRFYKKKGGDDIWFIWTHSYKKGGDVRLHFSACPE